MLLADVIVPAESRLRDRDCDCTVAVVPGLAVTCLRVHEHGTVNTDSSTLDLHMHVAQELTYTQDVIINVFMMFGYTRRIKLSGSFQTRTDFTKETSLHSSWPVSRNHDSAFASPCLRSTRFQSFRLVAGLVGALGRVDLWSCLFRFDMWTHQGMLCTKWSTSQTPLTSW
jgi:hypothetical protein